MTDDQTKRATNVRSIVSERFADGSIVEMVMQRHPARTALALHAHGSVSIQEIVTVVDGVQLAAIRAENNLIRHGAVLLPERPESYESTATLVAEIDAYINRYVDLSDHFRRITCAYILLTWVYDAFNELPYLRFRGDFGSGKSRALSVVGSIAYKPFFASGASTVSPIFHTLDMFRGTLVFDEADFRFSDEKSELVKIFNNGNVRGFPVLRTAITNKHEFDPRAFNVYGPKIVAMRKSFDDPALESRFITEEMGQRSLRHDIPINLPDTQKEEALQLRNKLLTYRFETLQRARIDETLRDPRLSARLNQILIPLLSIIESARLRAAIQESSRGLDDRMYADRSTTIEAGVLEVLDDLFRRDEEAPVAVAAVAAAFAERYGREYERPITARFAGGVLRNRLRLMTYKSHGVYVLPASERPKVAELCVRYGVNGDKDSSRSAVNTSTR
jgi:hypothetical protein